MKATPELIDEAKDLRKTGLSYRKIGILLNLSNGTIQRWLKPEYRKKGNLLGYKRYFKNKNNIEYRNQYKKRNLNRKKWAYGQKQKAVDYLGGCCKICGYNKCLAALDFHHKNPSEKEGFKSY